MVKEEIEKEMNEKEKRMLGLRRRNGRQVEWMCLFVRVVWAK